MSVETLKVQIIKKAWEDPAFRADLLANPKQAIKDAFGVDIPADIELHAVEETPSKYYLVIPPKPEDLPGGGTSVGYVWN
ncbi:NHLP leader peptide family RiPP precursor [Paenibacillus sp. GCM10027626]|uniref:NHLP leader peptide family RiPP precursor n=1 Tax=Paenibacillus sp. GCM10027626 TaxID=3273411 RepID=UPI00362CDB7D